MKKLTLTAVHLLLILFASSASAQGPVLEDVSSYNSSSQNFRQNKKVFKRNRNFPGTQNAVAPGADDSVVSGASRTNMRSEPNSLIQISPVLGYTNSSFADIKGINGAKVESLGGYQAGGLVDIGRGRFQFETGLLYSERGAKITNATNLDQGTFFKADNEFKLKYLEIPALAKLNFGSRKGFHASIKGGAMLGMLQSSEEKITGAQLTNYNGKVQDKKDNTNEFDPRLLAGAGVGFNVGSGITILLNADYQYGLTKVFKTTDTDVEPKNSSASIQAGVGFDL